jgi:ABC-type Na+ efflux pump permease subunit
MFDFERVWLVAKREWLTRVRQRSFRITTMVQIAIFLIAACIPTIAAILSDDDGPDRVTVQVLDETGTDLVGKLTPYLAIEIPDQATIDVVPFTGNMDALRASVDNDDADAGLAITRDAADALAFSYVTNNDGGDLLSQSRGSLCPVGCGRARVPSGVHATGFPAG